MIASIQEASHRHERTSADVARTFERLLDHAQQGVARLPELDAALAELRRRSEAVIDELARFGEDTGATLP